MSIFTKLLGLAADVIPGGGLIKTGIKLATPAIASIFTKSGAKAVAGSAAAAGLGYGFANVTTGGQSMNLPIGQLPTLAGLAASNTAMQASSPGGLPVPWWKGAGGKLQAPWSDPKIPEYLKQFALDDAYLRTYVRAPRGYVIVRDANGKPFAVLKKIAQQAGIWRAPRKPPISAGDWNKFKTAERVEKKLMKIAGPAIRKRQRKSSRACVTTRKGK